MIAPLNILDDDAPLASETLGSGMGVVTAEGIGGRTDGLPNGSAVRTFSPTAPSGRLTELLRRQPFNSLTLVTPLLPQRAR